ncbi:MAG: VWA domain-containing protein, partial [Chloroflexales bacterium]|nr:VWA domain-containing protein [Chloroflexales bacterium]
MRRVLLPAAVLALLVAMALILASALVRPPTAPLPGGAARVEQVDTSAYPEISLYVSLADQGGGPLLGLGRDDFALTEDGVPVEITAFGGSGEGAVTSVLVVDRSLSMADESKIDGAQAAAATFVDLLRPGDRAALLTFNDDVVLAQPFTGDVAALTEAIDELRPMSGTALYDAVVAGVEMLRDQP